MQSSSARHPANFRDSSSHATAMVNVDAASSQHPDPQALVSEEDDHAKQSSMAGMDHTTQQQPPLNDQELPICSHKATHKPMELSCSSGAPQTRDQQLAAQIASATRPDLRPTAQVKIGDSGPVTPPSDNAASPSTAMVLPEHSLQQQLLGPGNSHQQPSVMDNAATRSELDQHWPARSSAAGGKALAGLSRPGKLSGSRIMRFEAVADSPHNGKNAALPVRPGSAHASKRARRKSLLRSQSRTGSQARLSVLPIGSAQLHPAVEATHTGRKHCGIAQLAMICLCMPSCTSALT